MKSVLFFITLLFGLSPFVAHAGIYDSSISVTGCINVPGDNAQGEKFCFINLDKAINLSNSCNSSDVIRQLKWQQVSNSGELNNVSDEFFAMALMAHTTGKKLRVSLDENDCYLDVPQIKWMSIKSS